MFGKGNLTRQVSLLKKKKMMYLVYLLRDADGIIGNVTRKYADTRSQANLSKINSDASQDVDIMSESFSRILQRRRRLGMVFWTLSEL